MLNGMEVKALTRSPLFAALNPEDDRVLVLIQLNGGNDGLNMVVPIDQYDNLQKARPDIILPESDLLKVNDTLGLHPYMESLKNELYNQGRLALVQSVGYPNQNRSHFRSTDIWTTASDANKYVSSGWIGRYFDDQHPGWPDGFPNSNFPDPMAITVGNLVSETCQGEGSTFSLALTDPFNLSEIAEGVNAPVDISTCYGMELKFLQNSIFQSNEYATVVEAAASKGKNNVAYPDTKLADQLKTIALLINGGLKTKIYVANLNGFDTHAGQVNVDDPKQGTHGELLQTIAEAVTAFQQDLIASGQDKRVVGMTFSEFGRQIAANNAYGTDHGTAAPLFVFGSCVIPGVVGSNPQIADTLAPQEGVAMQIDFRSVYASLLKDWFGASESTIEKVLFGKFSYLPLVQACTTTASTPVYDVDLSLQLTPNPIVDQGQIKFKLPFGSVVRLSIFDARGAECMVLSNRKVDAGDHHLNFGTSNLPSGHYYLRLATATGVSTVRFGKM